MKFLARLGVIFYLVTIIFSCLVVILFSLEWMTYQEATFMLNEVTSNLQVKTITILVSLGIILLSLIFSCVISGGQDKDRTIAFDNPSGRVIISILALEDMIKRFISKMPDIKDVKATITTSKKGLEVVTKVVLSSDLNVPNFPSVHNIGLNDKTVGGFAKITGDDFAFGEYEWMLKSIATKIHGLDQDELEKLECPKEKWQTYKGQGQSPG